MTEAAIAFAGDGWGAVAALASLQREFRTVEVSTADVEVEKLLRPQDSVIATVADATAAIIVCAGYKPIIPANELQRRAFVNVHYSVLPRYRGIHPAVWAIINGEHEHGLSVHLMNMNIDDGPILVQHKFDILEMNARQVMERCNEWVRENLGRVIHEFWAGNVTPHPQDKSLATWVPRRNADDCNIDFQSTCAALRRFFRALVHPYPLPRIVVRGEAFEVAGAEILERPYSCTVGRVVNIDEEGAWIKISDGLMVVKTLTKNGNNIMASSLLKMGQRL